MTAEPAKQRELQPQRLNHLRAILRENQAARVDALCKRLGVSPATVRRDLEELERRGEIRRVHGGAVLVGQRLDEPVFDDKAAIAAREKQRIAEEALAHIEPRDTVYLDGGSTVLALARLLRDRSNITVVTNSLRAALELAGGTPQVILTGGELRKSSQAMVGPLTRFVLEQLHIDKAFMGTIGLALEEGLTTTSPQEAYTKELAMRRARKVILLADSTKVGKVAFAHAGKLGEVDVLITDQGASAPFLKGIRRAGVQVVRA